MDANAHELFSRGIKNVSGVACHISCALQIIYHLIPTRCQDDMIDLSIIITDSAVLGSEKSDELLTFLVELGNLFQLLGNRTPPPEEKQQSSDKKVSVRRNDGIDPSQLYKTFGSRLDPSRVGDVTASLRTILQFVSQCLEHCVNMEHSQETNKISQLGTLIYEGFRSVFWQGILSHQIIGSRSFEETKDSEHGESGNTATAILQRKKPAKDRSLPCPVTIPVRGQRTVEASIGSIIGSSQAIRGYNWELLDQCEYEEERTIFEDLDSELTNGIRDVHLDVDNSSLSSSSNPSVASSSESDSASSSSSYSTSSSDDSLSSCEEWKTAKVLRCKKLPRVLILHLNRSEFRNGRIKLIRDGILVPSELNLDVVSDSVPGIRKKKFHLVGAVVHKDDGDKNEYDDSDGHYVSYVKCRIENSNISAGDTNEIWNKIDDENVTPFIVRGDNDNNENHFDPEPSTNVKIVSQSNLCAMLGGNTKKKDQCAIILMYHLLSNDLNAT